MCDCEGRCVLEARTTDPRTDPTAGATASSTTRSLAAVPVYEVYALRYAGPFTSKLAFLLWNQGWDETVERYYYLWAIKGPTDAYVVDTGVGVTCAAERKLPNYVNPVELLGRIGLDGSNVTRVFVSHMHFDHAGGTEMFADAFPKATFYVQRRELDFWTRHPAAKRKIFADTTDPAANRALMDLARTGRLEVVDGDRVVAPGIELLLTPGHTVGLQAVAVNTVAGTAIVASDCAHLRRNIEQDTPSILITDLVAWMESYDKLRSKASGLDLVFPGHDAAMLRDYPRVAADVTRLA